MTIADNCREWARACDRRSLDPMLAWTLRQAASEIDLLRTKVSSAVCEGATIGSMIGADKAQERERRLREALRGLVAAHDRWRDAVRSVVGPGFGDGAFPELEAARGALGDVMEDGS